MPGLATLVTADRLVVVSDLSTPWLVIDVVVVVVCLCSKIEIRSDSGRCPE